MSIQPSADEALADGRPPDPDEKPERSEGVSKDGAAAIGPHGSSRTLRVFLSMRPREIDARLH
jgi:hypothetical protein